MLRDWTDSEKVNGLSVHSERFFTRLIMVVDDFGCYYANTSLLKAKCFPLLLDQVREADITRWMDECHQAGLIVLYESTGKKYLQIVDFNQRMDKARAKYPLPDGQQVSLQGYVYFMGINGSDVFKIGHSLNPWARLKEVSRSRDAVELLKDRSKDIELRFTFKGTTENERMIHGLLRERNIKNEWFKLNEIIIHLLSSSYNDNKTAEYVIKNFSSQTVDNYVPAETETERKLKPNRAKALVVADATPATESQALKKEWEALVEHLTGKDLKTVWSGLRDFISQKKPDFIDPYKEAWNIFASQYKLASVEVLNESGKKKFKTRIQEQGFDFLKILEKIKGSVMLKGLNGDWKVSFDWIIENDNNYAKILNGNYD